MQIPTDTDQQWRLIRALCDELATPLTQVALASELLSGDTVAAEARAAQLDALRQNAVRARSLMNGIRMAADISHNQLALALEPVDVGSLAREVVEELQPLARLNGRALVLHVSRPLNPAMGHREACRNAIYGCIEGLLRSGASPQLEVHVRNKQDGVLVTVQDDERPISGHLLDGLQGLLGRRSQLGSHLPEISGLALCASRTLCDATDGELRPSRTSRRRGLALEWRASRQLQLI